MNKIYTRIFFAFLILSIISIAFVSNAESAPPPRVTAPIVSNTAVSDITDTSAKITFNVDQPDAETIVHYGTSRTMLQRSDSVSTGLTRTITLSGLTKNTKYYFSVYASNGTQPSRSSNFPRPNDNFQTTGAATPDAIIPGIGNVAVSNVTNTSAKITFTVDQVSARTIVHYGTTTSIIERSNWNNDTTLTRTIVLSNLGENRKYYFSVYAYNSSDLTKSSHSQSASFTTNNSSSADPVTPAANNTPASNGTTTPEFGTGNRIWDSSKNMSTNYIWTPYSFAGFYYDIDNNISSEELRINNIKRSIDVDDITYTTLPQEVKFGYTNFGKYQVIGFMADKYFAGYKNSTIPGPTNSFDDVSALAQGQLHKVLIDDDSKRTISVGGTIALQDGYVLKATDIDLRARTMLLALLKDGTEVDVTPLSKDETYVYKKRVGSVEDLPLILVRFDNVFSGQELQTAFLKGIFQISENATSVKVGDKYNRMEVSSVSRDKIVMTNSETVGLSPKTTIDLMGDLKIIVADDSDKLRFALSVVRSGAFEVRGTIYPVTRSWTPMNFGLNVGGANIGFYYDLDEDIGTESLNLESISESSIPIGGLVYSTSPQQVSFKYSNFGKYQVVGFMADKYFAGYSGHTIPGPTNSFDDVSALSQGQLHKVLMDDDVKRTISVGGTLALKDGYVIKATDIDLNARTMLLSLLKDGTEVDVTPLSKDETYVYKKRVGSVEDLPLILVRFDNVFSGQELQTAFLKGIFQISETPTSIKVGDSFGNMEVTSVSKDTLTMENKGSIGLSRGNDIDIMGSIKFKVADSSDLRFYPFVYVTPDMVGTQLKVDIPSRAIGGDTISVNVTAAGAPVEGASVTIDPEAGPTSKATSANGSVNITFPKRSKGVYKVTVAKVGYESANKTIDIQQYIEGTLSIDIPQIIDQFEKIPIKITSNGTSANNTNITYDNVTIGTTDKNGNLDYVFNESGSHNIVASKSGYVSVSRDVDIRAPFSEFKANDISIVPGKTFTGDAITISSNITNVGTKADTKYVDLIVNSTIVGNKSVTLSPKETKEINFTHKISLPQGNYTIEVLEQKGLIEVQKSSTSIILIAAIITIVGVIAIFAATTKKGKEMIAELTEKVKDMTSKKT